MANVPKSKRCPLCGKPTADAAAPFCSAGCRDRDLLKWLGDGYAIPGPPAEEQAILDRLDSDGSEG
jgi:endogenous inhibitor of DNA gyrase (YacG/DUF329 family)